jgi:DNA-binding PadR family transcriptional regulator
MVSSITPLGIASLALLAERPMHPYEMYQVLIQRSEDRIVKVRPGSLYHTVDRLAGQGLVRSTGTDREGNRPERTTYEITEAGAVSLSERVSEMLEMPVNEFPQFPLAIAQAHNLPRESVIPLLERRVELLRTELEYLTTGLTDLASKNVARKFWLDVSYLTAIYKSEIQWITELLADFEDGAIDW